MHKLHIVWLMGIAFISMTQGCAVTGALPMTNTPASRVAAKQIVVNSPSFKAQIFGKFLLPEVNEKNVIYLMTAMNKSDGSSPYEIAPHQQVDLELLLKAKGLRGDHLSEKQLFGILLEVETKSRMQMKTEPNFMRAVIYVGQSVDLLSRAKRHRSDALDEVKQLQSAKVRWLSSVLQNHFVRMNFLVKNIPIDYLDIFESLIGHLYSVLDFKGSAQIGTTAAFKTLQQYLEWPERIEYLAKLGLLDSMEEDRERLREMILPFTHPWSFWYFFTAPPMLNEPATHSLMS